MKQVELDFGALQMPGTEPKAPPPEPPVEVAVHDESGRRIGVVSDERRKWSEAYPYVAMCEGCQARQPGWAQLVSAEMWLLGHARTKCPGWSKKKGGRT